MSTHTDLQTEPPNVLHGVADPNSSYTTINLAEAMPGVATPLGWSIWGPPADLAGRAPWAALGAIDESEVTLPSDPSMLTVNVFYGRAATRVNFHCEMGDLVPGTSGTDLARDAFGFVPPGFVSRPATHRHAIVAEKAPIAFAAVPDRVAAARARTQAWVEEALRRIPNLDLDGARSQLADATERFSSNLITAAVVIICGIQPAFTQLMQLAAKAGVDPGDLMRGHGSHEETTMIEDLWLVSRDRMSLEEFTARHGYHGPFSGEISQRSWREDPEPLVAIVDGYRGRPDDEDPVRAAEERSRAREAAERALLDALPSAERPEAQVVLEQAGRYLPLRAVAKVAFLQSLDVARAAARRVGQLLAESGVLADPDDVFYLTVGEICGTMPDDARATVAERRELRARYQELDLPTTWTGVPEPVRIAAQQSEDATTLQGVGVSPGVVEGTARIVHDPAETDMEPGEILVGHTTDPSWASVMFLASALVVDIGGQLSHAAVVARELGVPCVMNTGSGTRTLRDGDQIRVDGGAGTVEIIARA